MNQFKFVYDNINVEDLFLRSFKFSISKSQLDVKIIFFKYIYTFMQDYGRSYDLAKSKDKDTKDEIYRLVKL